MESAARQLRIWRDVAPGEHLAADVVALYERVARLRAELDTYLAIDSISGAQGWSVAARAALRWSVADLFEQIPSGPAIKTLVTPMSDEAISVLVNYRGSALHDLPSRLRASGIDATPTICPKRGYDNAVDFIFRPTPSKFWGRRSR